MSNGCMLCDSEFESIGPDEHQHHWIQCERCGKFRINLLGLSTNGSEFQKNRHRLSGFFCEMNYLKKENEEELKKILENNAIRFDFYEKIIKNNPVIPDDLDIDAKILKLLKYVEFNTTNLGQVLEISDWQTLIPLSYAKDQDELDFLWQIIENENLVRGLSIKNGQFKFSGKGIILTREGLQFLKGSVTNLKQIFVAMEFNDEMHNVFDIELIDAIRVATGFTLKVVSHIDHNNLIDDQIIAEINRSAAIIADFSDNNRGAYYEAGYAHGLNRQVIFICREDKFNNASEKPHFDIEHRNFILWKDKEDLKNRLINRINMTLNRNDGASQVLEGI